MPVGVWISMSDVKMLFAILIFLSCFLYAQTMFQTGIIEAKYDTRINNYSENSTVLLEETMLPAPPVCKPANIFPIDEEAGIFTKIIQIIFNEIDKGGSALTCFGDYAVWMVQLMFYVSSIDLFNSIIMVAIMGTLGFIVLRFVTRQSG